MAYVTYDRVFAWGASTAAAARAQDKRLEMIEVGLDDAQHLVIDHLAVAQLRQLVALGS